MKQQVVMGALLALAAGVNLGAQDARVFLDEARQAYREAAQNVLSSATEMPPQDYGFRPASDARSFGELLGELVRSQDDLCSTIAGRDVGRNDPRPGTKEAVVTALQNSDRACRTAYAGVTPFQAAVETGWGAMRQTKLGLMFLNTARDRELYGRLAVYLRMKGLQPPSERARVVPLD